ncbi:MAG TPA: PQQ-binding-like beta-propeller repeat protein [Candidatus Anammoximicrobium sp.]|nr:PQQ-binding-like beta-propeller repeat protein [Candidatus Anammoximicrobium sp.]
MLRWYASAGLFAIGLVAAGLVRAENWPCWRGPRGDGTSEEKQVPLRWNGVSGENIVWKTPLPGRGHSSPIVWGDRLFLVACVEASQSRIVFCVDRPTGQILWQRTVISAPLERRHNLNSFASGTPATDGELVYATFLEPDFGSKKEATPGNLVVAAYDLAGNPRWLVRPGRFSSVHGFCSSPVLFEDQVIVNGDHDGDSYIVALDRKTGEIRWKTPRPNKTRSYCTPIIREMDGRTQMILSGSLCVVSMDPRDGSQHWIIDGPTEQFVASLVYNGQLLFLTAGFPEHHILAIKPDGRGNVTHTHVAWRTTKGCSYVPSPIVSGEYFLVAADNGICSCFVAATGERLWMERLSSHYSASLIEANGLVYFQADDGEMKIVRPGRQLEVVAANPLGEYCYASPAVSQGQIFLRGEKHLYCIGQPQ